MSLLRTQSTRNTVYPLHSKQTSPYVSFITADEEGEEDQCDEEATFVNTVVRRYVDKMRAVTWERIKSETNNDPLMCELSKWEVR